MQFDHIISLLCLFLWRFSYTNSSLSHRFSSEKKCYGLQSPCSSFWCAARYVHYYLNSWALWSAVDDQQNHSCAFINLSNQTLPSLDVLYLLWETINFVWMTYDDLYPPDSPLWNYVFRLSRSLLLDESDPGIQQRCVYLNQQCKQWLNQSSPVDWRRMI